MSTPHHPVAGCEVLDPRIRRTRQLLQSALRSLMRTKSLEEISVQDIAEASTVNRATFYDHYPDKFALLEAMVASGFHQMLFDRKVQYDPHRPLSADAIIHAACEFLELSHQGCECKGQSAFEPYIDGAITGTIRRVLLRGLESDAATAGDGWPAARIVAASASWAIAGAVKEWFYTPNRSTPEEAVCRIRQLILPMLQNVSPRTATAVHPESPSESPDSLPVPAGTEARHPQPSKNTAPAR